METYDIEFEFVFNMDETPIKLGICQPTTLTFKGAKNVIIRLKDYSRSTVTLALLVSATGEKLKQFVLFKRIKNPNYTLPRGQTA